MIHHTNTVSLIKFLAERVILQEGAVNSGEHKSVVFNQNT